MPPTVTSVKIPSTPMQKGVKSTIVLADQAISAGNKALAASKKKLSVAIGTGKKGAIRAASSAVLGNQKTLIKAVALRAQLQASVKLANSLCHLNVLFSDYPYVVPE